jgi:hypothetical protein
MWSDSVNALKMTMRSGARGLSMIESPVWQSTAVVMPLKAIKCSRIAPDHRQARHEWGGRLSVDLYSLVTARFAPDVRWMRDLQTAPKRRCKTVNGSHDGRMAPPVPHPELSGEIHRELPVPPSHLLFHHRI